MTSYEIWTLIISGFTAIGTCGATIFALYFWLNDKKIKLNSRIWHANIFGDLTEIENGFFVVILTNKNAQPLMLEAVGIKIYQKNFWRKQWIGFNMFTNTKFDSLPKKIGFGETYVYVEPMNETRRKLQKFQEEQNTKIYDIKIYLSVPTANRDLYLKIPKLVKEKLLS